jgi:hypothetical protein
LGLKKLYQNKVRQHDNHGSYWGEQSIEKSSGKGKKLHQSIGELLKKNFGKELCCKQNNNG